MKSLRSTEINTVNRPAEYMRDILLEKNEEIVWYGSRHLIKECADRLGIYEDLINGKLHPLSLINKILSSLAVSDLFVKGHINHVGITIVAFRLKDTARKGLSVDDRY